MGKTNIVEAIYYLSLARSFRGVDDDELILNGEDYAEIDKDAKLSNNNYSLVAEKILEALGGKENITSADYCATRLRLEVKDQEVINEKAVKAAGAAGMIRPGKTSVQVVIGTQVQFVYDELAIFLKKVKEENGFLVSQSVFFRYLSHPDHCNLGICENSLKALITEAIRRNY